MPSFYPLVVLAIMMTIVSVTIRRIDAFASCGKAIARPAIMQSLFRRSSSLAAESSHQSNSAAPQMSPEDQALFLKLKEFQSTVPKPTFAEDVRTLMETSIGFGVLSTNSDTYAGYPTGSVVGYSLEGDKGLPYFVFSTMSAHTRDIVKDGRVSLTVTAKDFKGAAEGRVVLIGDVVKVQPDADRLTSLRDGYLARHKDAYWIDFGDFSYFAMTNIVAIRYIGGFAMAGSVNPEDYYAAKADPLAAFASPVMKHMNDDHTASLVAMVKHYAGVPCPEAQMVSMDRLGMVVKAKLAFADQGFAKIRLPFPQPVSERKAVKEAIVEMTKASSS